MMKNLRTPYQLLPCLLAAMLTVSTAITSVAEAQDGFCLSAFYGDTLYRVDGQLDGPITGYVSGNISPCGTAGGNLPLSGTAIVDPVDGSYILGFQIHSVDNPNLCGSVEVKVIIDPDTLSGPLSLWNTKREFENTSTATYVRCDTTAPVRTLAAGQIDVQGNVVN